MDEPDRDRQALQRRGVAVFVNRRPRRRRPPAGGQGRPARPARTPEKVSMSQNNDLSELDQTSPAARSSASSRNRGSRSSPTPRRHPFRQGGRRRLRRLTRPSSKRRGEGRRPRPHPVDPQEGRRPSSTSPTGGPSSRPNPARQGRREAYERFSLLRSRRPSSPFPDALQDAHRRG